jgi:hypothetical protein
MRLLLLLLLLLTACTTAPTPTACLRTLEEIHAEGLEHAPNIRDWPEPLRREWEATFSHPDE